MKIYTKKGDGGETGLYGGKRLPKDDIRIEAYGTVDELNSWLGLLRDGSLSTEDKNRIIDIQEELFTIGSHLAADPDKKNLQLPELNSESIGNLESWIDQMDEELEPMRFFVLPGGHAMVSNCHIARTICRKAERRVISLSRSEEVGSSIIPYLNRLSDLLFTYSRFLSSKLGAEEIPWKPRS